MSGQARLARDQSIGINASRLQRGEAWHDTGGAFDRGNWTHPMTRRLCETSQRLVTRLEPSCGHGYDLRHGAARLLAQSVHPTIVREGLSRFIASLSLNRHV